MDISEAAEHMADMYRTAPHGEKATMMDLFGVKYAQELDSMAQDRSESLARTFSALLQHAGLSQSYKINIRDGMKLSQDRSRPATPGPV